LKKSLLINFLFFCLGFIATSFALKERNKNYVSDGHIEFINSCLGNFARAEEKLFTETFLEYDGRTTKYLIWYVGEIE